MEYEEKYLKYKNKYLALKNSLHTTADENMEQTGGFVNRQENFVNRQENFINRQENFINRQDNFVNRQFGGGYQIWIFDKLAQIITLINSDYYDKNRDIILQPKDLEKFAKQNNLRMQKFIIKQKNYKGRYFHVSDFPIEKVMTNNKVEFINPNHIYQNPKGLWLSCGAEWLKFTEKQIYWSISKYIYEIIPSDSVLYINDLKEFKQFINKYKKKVIKIYDVIDWQRVKKDYDGMIVCPYLGDKIWGKNARVFHSEEDRRVFHEYIENGVGKKWKTDIYFLAEWYRHWDTGSGVIWRNSGVAEINLLRTMNEYDDFIEKMERKNITL